MRKVVRGVVCWIDFFTEGYHMLAFNAVFVRDQRETGMS